MSDDIDRLCGSSNDRVVQVEAMAPFSRMPGIECRQGRDEYYYPNTKTGSPMTDIKVLTIVGLRAGSVIRELAKVEADCSADGIALNLFDSLSDLPRYSETLEGRGTPSSVGALRTAAAEADAVLIVTTYHGRVPVAVHNAIDWLTRRWDQAALHDKPLAVIGPASGRYSGVWSHQTEDADRIAGPRVIESITVSTLREAIKKLVGEVHAGSEPSWVVSASEGGQ
ncbi:MAG TPA: NADPH-dependent FMN reductase [Mycobacterium sp.]|nr:NADPH-dependent FMN reductase [Mycobacterium sp.]